MLPTPVRDHLANIRAAGIPLADIYLKPGYPNQDLTVHDQQCPEVLYVTANDVTDVPDQFRLNDCNVCQNYATATLTEWISNLRALVEEAEEVANLTLELLNEDGTPRRPNPGNPGGYASIGRALRRSRLNDGGSSLEDEYSYLADQMDDAYAALGEYSLELARDLTLQWRRLAAHQLVRAKTLGPNPTGHGQRIRAIENVDYGGYVGAAEDATHDEALCVEATRILEGDGWDLIDWHDCLPSPGNGHDVADPRQLSVQQLEQVLTLYAVSGREGAPLQDLVDAIDVAHNVR